MPETNSEGHRLGIQVFVDARDPHTRGGLSEAAFWVGLRQEIYSALMRHESIQIKLEHYIVDRSVSPTSDYGWANRAVVHCADVLNCCFGKLGVSNTIWRDLVVYNESWEKAKSPGFTPVYFKEPDRAKKEVFPQVWYFQACHSRSHSPSSCGYAHFTVVIGIQHYLLAKILLAIFDPRLPRIGGSRSKAVRSMEVNHLWSWI